MWSEKEKDSVGVVVDRETKSRVFLFLMFSFLVPSMAFQIWTMDYPESNVQIHSVGHGRIMAGARIALSHALMRQNI